ncbi:MAG: CDP-alcohol phosphatidyltransferase family protein [Gammaproteobacteria bacterium]|nr:CDP-alcohol phosphatidyltransferase family protein [Gammaproteobacteria bacterium]
MKLRPAHIPNAICIVRILLVLPIVLYLLDGRFDLALLLILVAGGSDGVDGFLARRFDWRTRLGGLLDPAADKLLVMSLFLTLAWLGLTPVWLASIVILRDATIVGGASAYTLLIGKVQPEPSNISKLNTIFELSYLLSVVAQQAFGWPLERLVLVLGAGVLVTAVLSGLDYVLTWSGRARAARAT